MRTPNQPVIVAVVAASLLVPTALSMAVFAATPAPTATVAPPSTAKVTSISVPRVPATPPIPSFVQALAAQQQKQIRTCGAAFSASYANYTNSLNTCIATNEAAYNALTVAQQPATCQFYGFSTVTACTAGINGAITNLCTNQQSPSGTALLATYRQCACNAGVTAVCS
ncbi:MAG TPA: hypothetical protein VK841_20555 [Polyangiaceae bacterium]|jgi:hypothetical protein|nr:hypothetical protein [Polyangiaceae bacterium]